MNLARREQRKKIQHFFAQPVVSHSLVWFFAFLIHFALQEFDQSFFFHFTNSLLRISVWMCLVYYNREYLIPNYLTKDRILTYFGLLILSVLIITPIGNILLYFKFNNYPQYQQYLAQTHHSHFLVNFFVVGASAIIKIISDWVKHQRERAELQTQTMQSELRYLKKV